MKDPKQVAKLYATDAAGTTVELHAKFEHRYQRRFLTMFDDTLVSLSRLSRPPTYFRLLLICLVRFDPVQYRRISLRDLAAEAGLSMSSAERAFSLLRADNVVMTTGRASNLSCRLNIHLLSKSSSRRYFELSEGSNDPALPEK